MWSVNSRCTVIAKRVGDQVSDAAPPEIAVPLYEEFLNAVRALGVRTASGRFGAMMQVELVNDGPVTLIVESK